MEKLEYLKQKLEDVQNEIALIERQCGCSESPRKVELFGVIKILEETYYHMGRQQDPAVGKAIKLLKALL